MDWLTPEVALACVSLATVLVGGAVGNSEKIGGTKWKTAKRIVSAAKSLKR